MTITSVWHDIVLTVTDSPVWHGAVGVGILVLAFVGIVAVIALVAFILSQLFKKNPRVRKVYRVSIYILTLTGVLILLFGALIGFLFPVIPGVLLLFLALLLLRRVYHNKWIDKNIQYLRWKLKMKRKVKRARKNVQRKVKHARGRAKEQIGKALRTTPERRE